MDLKDNRQVSNPLTPASEGGPLSQPERRFSRKPHAVSLRLCWGRVMESCGLIWSSPTSLAVLLDLRIRSRVSEYWSSHPSTMSKEAMNRATRHSQPNCWRSIITVSRELSYHQVQMVNVRTVNESRSALCSLWVAAASVSHLDTRRNYKLEHRNTVGAPRHFKWRV